MEHMGSYLSLLFSFGDTSEPDILGDNTIANHTTMTIGTMSRLNLHAAEMMD